MDRKAGISVLLATQNEEAIVGLSLLSFLEFGDEIIVVDNGSTDKTKEIVLGLQSRYPQKIKFFDVPELQDLFQNRQYAFEKSSFRWVVRADADFVAYTDGENDIVHFREFLLSQNHCPSEPKVYGVPQPNVTGDFWSTGLEENLDVGPDACGRYVPPPYTLGYMMRIYEVFAGFEFVRLGRWEGIRHQEILSKTRITLEHPLWMHCNIKSNMNYLFRSERTNWRELGDYQKYPTLNLYLQEIARRRYQTTNLVEASTLYFDTCILPYLQLYDENQYLPYPEIVKRQIEKNAIYRITWDKKRALCREFLGLSQF